MARERILVIDDKTEILTFLVDLLEPLHYQVMTVSSGREGLALALAESPDLILLDLNMPGTSGLEVLEGLHRRGCRSPVILMTLFGSESIAVEAFRLGARNYIGKPFDINELLVTIEWTLEEGRLRREREELTEKLAEANQTLTQRMRELATLQAIGRSVASLMPREQLLRRLLDAAIYLAAAESAGLFVVDPELDELRLEAACRGDDYRFGLSSGARDPIAEEVRRSGQVVWQPGALPAPGAGTAPGAGACLYVPLDSSGQVIGVLRVTCRGQDRELSIEIQNRLTTLADYAAIALRNANLYARSEQQAQQLATINRVAQVIASSLDLGQIMNTVVASMRALLQVESASLVLLDEDSGELVFEIVKGGAGDGRGPFRLKVGQGVVGWAIERGCTVRVNEVDLDPRFYSGVDRVTGFHTHSILCVPLDLSGKVIGAIEVLNKLDPRLPGGRGSFSERDEEMLRQAAAFVAVAVENARLHTVMRQTVATQTLQETMVTLSHYVNNPLQALLGAAQILRADWQTMLRTGQYDADTVQQAVDLIRLKVQEIAVILSVLRDLVSPESALYLGTIQMLDIDEELSRRLEAIAG